MAYAYPFKTLQEGSQFIVDASQKAEFAKIRSASSYYCKKNPGVVIRTYTTAEGNLCIKRELDDNSKVAPASLLLPSHPSSVIPPVVLPPEPPRPIAIAGPTYIQWCTMLKGMAQETAIWINPPYEQFYNQMVAWTMEHAAFTKTNYIANIVGNQLVVSHGVDVVPTQENEPWVYDRNGEAVYQEETLAHLLDEETINIDELPEVVEDTTMLCPTAEQLAEELSIEREQAAIALNNDGWTNLPCRSCLGKGGCVYCSGTGKFYDKEQDLRVTPPAPDPLGDLAGVAKSIELLSRTTFANKTGKDDRENYE